MAIFLLSSTVEDAKGDQRTYNVAVPRGALTLGTITTFWTSMMALIDAITDVKHVAAGVQVNIPVPGTLKENAIANSDVQEGANFLFSAAGTDYKHAMRIPGLSQGLFVGKEVNTVDVEVAAFVTAMTDGILAGGVQVDPSDKYENDLLSLSSAKKTFRK